MATRPKDPTDPIRRKASRYPGVDVGTACTQSSFKAGKKSFLFIGMQGGRYKAMFKLSASLPEARRLAKSQPDNFEAGTTGWVTARFTAEKPIPKRLWEKWLDESYALSTGGATSKSGRAPAAKPATRKVSKKKVTKKRVAKKTTAKKTAKKAGKKVTKKKTTRARPRAKTTSRARR